jgi:predicted nucleotidyltransferase
MRQQASQKTAKMNESITTRRKLKRSAQRKRIELLCHAIAHEFHPEKIVLFGSHAYGEPRPDSDVDLLVVMPFEGSPFRQASIILGHVVRTVGVVPMDLLVRTTEQVNQRIQMGDSFMRKIIEQGRVMYEADHLEKIHH